MSLYLKYRPAELTQVKGNATVIATLQGMLADISKCPHAFLLHGPSGCGKTTLGRIIANRLGCNNEDFNEVDSADFRGIDTVREIRRNSQYKPIAGDCRVWLIDECHKMTNDAQNALLKILEDTPPHIYFILCTTEPQKLIETVKGRCIQLQVAPLSNNEMLGLLRRIVRSEGLEIEAEIYDQIVLDSMGRPRNAINILEQVLNVPADKRMEVAKQTAEQQSQIIELCRLLISGGNWAKAATILTGLRDKEAEDIRRAVRGYMQAVLLNKANDRAAATIEAFFEPTYNIGFPGIVYACYTVIKG